MATLTQSLSRITTAVALCAAGATASAAPVVQFQDDFEAGTAGNVPGTTAPVGTWTIERNDDVAPGDPVWQLANSPQGTSPTDNTTQFARTGRTDVRAVTYAGLADASATIGALVQVSMDFYVPTASTALWVYGSADTGSLSSGGSAGGRSFDVRLAGAENNISANVGDAQVRDGGDLNIVADTFTPDAWQSLVITANFLANTYDVTINGTSVVTGQAFEGSPTQLGSVRISGLTDSGGDPTDLVYIDNLVVTTDVVPEPGSIALLGLGGLMFARRRRH